MKELAMFFLAILIQTGLSQMVCGQYYVPTEPLNKNAILEEFTGVKCPNCPAGHQVLAQILAANPGRAFAVAFHPFNSSYTLPYPGDPDFRRHYADSLYMMPYCGTTRYMPSAFVNRRLWAPPERLTQRTNWSNYTNIILSEPSPLNVGMATSYDENSKMLSVTVDIYYTSEVTVPHNLMVTLAENNLVSQQSGATGPYTHKHTFRESFVAQWGDPITTGGAQGTFSRHIFSFSNADSNYNMAHCELLAYVIDHLTTEVITGIGCDVGDTTYIPAFTGLTHDTLTFITHQQCIDGLTTTLFNNGPGNLMLEYVAQEGFDPFMWLVDPWPFPGFPYTLEPGDSVDLTVHIGIPTDFGETGFLYDSLVIISAIDTHYVILAVDPDLISSSGSSPGDRRENLTLYPNPFSEWLNIVVDLREGSYADVEIFDLNGRKVKTLKNGNLGTGKFILNWDAADEKGRPVPGGIYFIRLVTEQQTFTRRCILLR